MLDILTTAIRQKKNNIKKKEEKLSLLVNDMIPYKYINNLIDSIKNVLELINKFSKVEGYKINTKSLLHFIHQWQSANEIKNTIPFTMCQNKKNYK